MVKDKRFLNDRYLRSLKPAPKGKKAVIWDTVVPSFGIVVGDAATDSSRHGKASDIAFILYARFAPGSAPTRRRIGVYGSTSLACARETANEWRRIIANGGDPAAAGAD